MSKIKFGALVVDARGKTGGTVFSRNAYGAYWKNRSIPTNPQSTGQQQVRANLANRSQGWRNLTDVERRSWKDMAVNFPRQNSIGDTIILSGLALLNSLNGNLEKVGQTQLVTPIAPVEMQFTEATIGAVEPTTIEIALSATLDANSFANIRATPCISAGINNWKTKLRDMAIVGNADGDALDMITHYTDLFGAPTTGSRIGFSYQVIDKRTGQASVPQLFSSTVG